MMSSAIAAAGAAAAAAPAAAAAAAAATATPVSAEGTAPLASSSRRLTESDGRVRNFKLEGSNPTAHGRYGSKLNFEKELGLRLKGENGIMKKKFSALQKDIEDQREEIRTMFAHKKELYQVCASRSTCLFGPK